jgi:hypothetical protein
MQYMLEISFYTWPYTRSKITDLQKLLFKNIFWDIKIE